MFAVETDVVQRVPRGLDLERILLGEVAQVAEVRVPCERVVVEVHLRVEREHVAVGRGDERVDLDEARIGGLEGLVDAEHQLRGLVDERRVDPDAKASCRA